MLARVRQEYPDVPLVHATDLPSPLPSESFSLVILFAVLTAIPEDASQRDLMAEIRRLLEPGGHAYVSDLPLQTDARRVARYQHARPPDLPYGTFFLENGRAVMRHHTEDWFGELFSDFEVVATRSLSVATMRRRSADAVQFLLRKP
jgi:SAM-dependent methyltransferase